jgi:chemotaxis protein CheD
MPAALLAGFENRVVVGMADFAVSNSPNLILTTYSLGSCLGIAAYDPVARAGGLLHTMLPDSNLQPEKALLQPGMFVDTGLHALLQAMAELDAQPERMKIYVVGGAQIMDSTGFFNIGKKNYEALTEILKRESLRIHAEQVGGLVNRTMHLNIATGGVSLKVSGHAKDTPLCKS